MNLRLILSFAACLYASQSIAQSAPEQLLDAMQVFRPSFSLGEPWLTHPQITDRLTGRWIVGADALMAGGNKKIPDDLMKRACEKSGSDITVSRYSIKMQRVYKRKDGSSGIMETVYADRGGNVYGFMTDPEQFLGWLGLADITDAKHLPAKYNSIRNATGIAHLFRPSKDILVILPIADRAQFALRCPTQ